MKNPILVLMLSALACVGAHFQTKKYDTESRLMVRVISKSTKIGSSETFVRLSFNRTDGEDPKFYIAFIRATGWGYSDGMDDLLKAKLTIPGYKTQKSLALGSTGESSSRLPDAIGCEVTQKEIESICGDKNARLVTSSHEFEFQIEKSVLDNFLSNCRRADKAFDSK